MQYLIVDACRGGTGIRDKYEGGYISPKNISLNHRLINQISVWLPKYENEHFNGFANMTVIDELDREGIEIAEKIKKELINIKIEYYSAAKMTSKAI
jgi:hypothetical protein